MAIGVHTSSFQRLLGAGRDPVDVLVEALTACGAKECELFAPQIEAQFGGPHAAHGSMSSMSPQMVRRELRKWRLRTPPRYFEAIGSRFRTAGITIRACNYSPDGSFTEQEIAHGVEMAAALGAAMLTATAAPDLAHRIAPFAAEHRMVVAFAGDAGAEAIGVSPYFKIVVDAAQLAPAGVNAAQYLLGHRADVAAVRVSCGQPDVEMRHALDAIGQGGGSVGVFVELRNGATPVEEVKRCLAAWQAPSA